MFRFLRSCKAIRPPVGRCSWAPNVVRRTLFAAIDRNREKVCALAVRKNARLPAAPRHLPSNMCLVLRAKQAAPLARGIAPPIRLYPVSALVRVVALASGEPSFVGAICALARKILIFIIAASLQKCPPKYSLAKPSEVEAPSFHCNDALFANANGPQKAPAVNEYLMPELCCA